MSVSYLWSTTRQKSLIKQVALALILRLKYGKFFKVLPVSIDEAGAALHALKLKP
jgi:hypothetical protein